jgi:hypothetical protein
VSKVRVKPRTKQSEELVRINLLKYIEIAIEIMFLIITEILEVLEMLQKTLVGVENFVFPSKMQLLLEFYSLFSAKYFLPIATPNISKNFISEAKSDIDEPIAEFIEESAPFLRFSRSLLFVEI